MGHGGTLDPMATGVLILGVGSGTKQLQHYMTECTKTYEAVVLFGAATDSYDTEGKIVGRKPFEHLSKEMVEEALAKFRGKGMQKPPIFSALRVEGKRMYEYAREGKELPVEIKERPVEVTELVMTEWMEGSTHKWHWPEREAEVEEKVVAKKALDIESGGEDTTAGDGAEDSSSVKRKRGEEEDGIEPANKKSKEDDSHATDRPEQAANDAAATAETDIKQLGDEAEKSEDSTSKVEPKPESEEKDHITTGRSPCAAPACRIRMKVTSGFYVRSFCHDLGAAVGSLGIMANLVRIQQGGFELGKNVLEYDDVKKAEEVWAPKVAELLEESKKRGQE